MQQLDDSTVADAYFASLLPWQHQAWQHVTLQHQQGSLPHAFMAAGMAGMGKRAFVWRLVAWLLCHQQGRYADTACGSCDSCQWLLAGTHPDLQVLPRDASPSFANDSDRDAVIDGVRHHIKIDDIRGIQDFVHHGSRSIRLCVFDHAETMTVAAANALLKTLEEPQHGVHLLLISDRPALLLPTIRSRVQQLPLQAVATNLAMEYMQSHLAAGIMPDSGQQTAPQSRVQQAQQLLTMASGAPLAAVQIANSPWYPLRQLWFNTWLHLRAGSRSALAASDYWQQQLCLSEFMTLSRLMLVDIERLQLGLPVQQQDVDFSAIADLPGSEALHRLLQYMDSITVSLQQNVQDKLAYDTLMQSLTQL